MEKMETNPRIFLFIVVFIQFFKTLFLFRNVDLRIPYPLLNVDFSIYYAKALRIHELLTKTGRAWGYDPYQMAGYPYSSNFTSAGFFFDGASHFLSYFFQIERVLLSLEFLVMLSFPFLGWLAVYLYNTDKRQASIYSFVTVVTYGTIEPISQLFLEKGLFPYQFAVYFLFLQNVLFWRWVKTNSWINWMIQTIASALLPLIHPTGLVLALYPCSILLIGVIRRPPKWFFVQLILSAAAVIGSNWVWLEPTIGFWGLVSTTDYLNDFGLNKLFGFYGFWGPGWILRSASILSFFFLIGCLVSLFRMFKENRHKALFFSGWLLYYFFIIGFGVDLNLRQIHPFRYIMPFWILVYSLAAIEINHALRTKTRWIHLIVLALGLGLVLVFLKSRNLFNPPLSNRWPQDQEEFIDYVMKNKIEDGRLLLECRELGNPHFLEYLAFKTKQQILGGPFGSNYLATKFTLFVTGAKPVIFERFLENISEEEFKEYIDLYNVHRIAVTSTQAAAILSRYKKFLKEINPVAGHRVYDVVDQSQWFFKGGGILKAKMDEISIQKATHGELILKYHWIPTLKTNPPIPIGPINLKDDPVPFIKIDNRSGFDDIVIYNSGFI